MLGYCCLFFFAPTCKYIIHNFWTRTILRHKHVTFILKANKVSAQCQWILSSVAVIISEIMALVGISGISCSRVSRGLDCNTHAFAMGWFTFCKPHSNKNHNTATRLPNPYCSCVSPSCTASSMQKKWFIKLTLLNASQMKKICKGLVGQNQRSLDFRMLPTIWKVNFLFQLCF